MRMALAAWMSNKEAPVGLRLAQATTMGILKARAQKGDSGGKPLNIAVQIAVAPTAYPTKRLAG